MKFAIAALLGLASVQGLDKDTTITYSNGLKCGQCIKGGFNFCIRGDPGEVVTSGDTVPVNTCCQDTTCSENTDTNYSCSSKYTAMDKKLLICPQR